MKWSDYLEEIMSNEKCLDGIEVTIENQRIELPKIAKASVFLLEKMMQNQGDRNIFVFPDKDQVPFLFMLSKVIYNILKGKVENKYSPEDFVEGQKLKIGNCIVQFIKIDNHPFRQGEKAIFVKLSDADSHALPLDMAPHFQVCDTKRKLSPLKSFSKTKKIIINEQQGKSSLTNLKAIMTHMKESVAYVSTVSDSERKSNDILINGDKIFDYILVAKADYEGKLCYYKGKYVGTPALIFSSLISYINAVIEEGNKVQSVIINLNEIDIFSQLDSLDELLGKKIPVLCIADTIKSMDLDELENRNFNIWRWDADSIVDEVCDKTDTLSENRIEKCVSSKIEYHNMCEPEVSEAFNKAYCYYKSIQNENAQMNRLYSKLMSIASSAVRKISPFNEKENDRMLDILDNCSRILNSERNFIDKKMADDLKKSIDILTQRIAAHHLFSKIDGINQLLYKERYGKLYLICQQQDNPSEVKEYWENRLSRNGYRPIIIVIYPKDFINLDKTSADVAILAGWFSGTKVKKIVYSYKVKNIHIFIYECEEKWKNFHTQKWKMRLKNDVNKRIAEKSFSKVIEAKFNENRVTKQSNSEQNNILDEPDDLDLIMQESKYRQYTVKGNAGEVQIVDAKPVGFAGGDFALFTENHKILIATKIISQVSNKIEKSDVSKLKVGDFIVVRESDKDLIREVADNILIKNGKYHYRKTVSLWKEALKIEEAFCSVEEIHKKLVDVGCTRGFQTVKNWLQAEDFIIPQSKEDLIHISEVTGNSELCGKIDEIFDAGRYIKSAHIKAGNILSERLMQGIASRLVDENEIDPVNICEPIEVELKEVGTIKLLKIIDIGQEYIPVDINNANKVLTEDKENILWQE